MTGESVPKKIADALLERYPQTAVVLTLGKDGVLYRDAEQCLKHGVYRLFSGWCFSWTAHAGSSAPSIPVLEEVLAARLELDGSPA